MNKTLFIILLTLLLKVNFCFSQSVIEHQGVKGVFITEEQLDFVNEVIVERDYFAKKVESKEVIIYNLRKINRTYEIINTLKDEQIKSLNTNILDYKQIVVIEKQDTKQEKKNKIKAYITGGLIGIVLGVLISAL